ncbi:MAG TPA: universal stress protein [Solirubrobacteraceae bacterium]|nr:universal stress protein [Solirubrobacteraceae bacterium]
MIDKIAVGTDGSPTAGKAVEFALELAEQCGSHVIFISSYKPVDENRLRREQREAPGEVQWKINPAEDVESTLRSAEEMATARGLSWTSEAREGDPADVLVDLAEEHEVDLLVIGNKGMERRLLGSIPNSVSHKARCSVAIIKTT